VTYKRINRTHLCLLQAHPHYWLCWRLPLPHFSVCSQNLSA
jgi:hypothetical protein